MRSFAVGAKELELPEDANPYYYYDLDWIVTVPNMDPQIRSFETIRENDQEVVVKTGFGASIRKKFDFPMPEFIAWETDSLEKLETFQFDAPDDRRRFFEAGDNQIAGVGDGFERNSPPWIETVKRLRGDFPVYGSMAECSECLTRMIGQENTMLWIGMYPERMGEAINRVGQFYLRLPEGPDRGGRRSVGRHGDLGRRGLQEEHVLLTRVLAHVFQAVGRRHGPRVSRT